MPLADVLPKLLAVLPLKKDHVEDKSVYDCLLRLLQARSPELMAVLPQLLNVFAQVIPAESGVAENIRGAVVRRPRRPGFVLFTPQVFGSGWCGFSVSQRVQAAATCGLIRDAPDVTRAAIGYLDARLQSVLEQVFVASVGSPVRAG